MRSHVLVTEPRHVALPVGHPLASKAVIPFRELLDEPFIALPVEAGELREHWLASEERAGRPVRVGAVAQSADDALEAVATGQGVALIAAGNAAIYARNDVVTRPVSGIPPARLAVIWRAADSRDIVRDIVTYCAEAALDDMNPGAGLVREGVRAMPRGG